MGADGAGGLARRQPERCAVRSARLKAVTRRLVERAGGAEVAALATRVAHSQLSAYGSLTERDRFAPVDVVADLERDIGDPLVTRELAGLAGFRLVPIDGAGPCGDEELGPRGITAIAARMGRLAGTIDAADDDGHLDLRELEAIATEAQALEDAARQVREAAQRKRAASR